MLVHASSYLDFKEEVLKMGNVEEQEEVGVIQNAKVKMLNIFLLGLVFCFLFTGFNTMSQTSVTSISSLNPPNSIHRISSLKEPRTTNQALK